MNERFPPSLPYRRRGPLLSAGERRFFHDGLAPAVAGRYLISCKVRLADVIAATAWDSPMGRKIAQKHCDFVLVTPRTTRVVAVIELNDQSHCKLNRKRRDRFFAAALRSAGIPLVMFPIYRQYDATKIRHRIAMVTKRDRADQRSPASAITDTGYGMRVKVADCPAID